MRNITDKVKNMDIDYNKLLEYGFEKSESVYIYEKNIMDDKFKVIIEVENKSVISKLIYNYYNEEYALSDVLTAGEYNNKVVNEYEYIINDMIDKCFLKNIFKNPISKNIISYVHEKYNDELEYLWEKFPEFAIVRNKNNKKWYMLIAKINGNVLNEGISKEVEIINVRYDKEKIESIVDNISIFRGYHMNKNNWITIVLNNKVPIKKIYELIDDSYEKSLKK